jgi:hypothetical protein
MSLSQLAATCLAISLALFAFDGKATFASDHADPIRLRFFGQPESNLTGLFAFEHKGKLVLALCARPGLADKNVDVSKLTFRIHIDTDIPIHFSNRTTDDEGRTFRYGGYVTHPENIKEDLSIEFRFEDLGKKNPFFSAGFGAPIHINPRVTTATDTKIDKAAIQKAMSSWVGLRDDPFILHGFSKTNVIGMVVELPFKALNTSGNFLIWGTCHQNGKQVDHVGRSLRTMLPRFDFLNKLHPSQHVNAIRAKHEKPDVVQDLMSTIASPFFGIRHYDFEPDVMYFSRNRWQEQNGTDSPNINDYTSVAFPNGRRLTDDVALLMCQRGDCLLFEVSTAEAHADDEVRPTTNGPKQFLDRLPYLAAPHREPEVQEVPALKTRTKIILSIAAVSVFGVVVLPWWLLSRTRKKLFQAQQQVAYRSRKNG